MNLTIRLRVVPDGIYGAAREILVPIFEPHPKIGAKIDREAPHMPATGPEAVNEVYMNFPESRH